MPSLLAPNLEKALKRDHKYFLETKLPIVTVSASFREDLKHFHELPSDDWMPDVVFSRAHFSMAVAIAVQAWGKQVDPASAWIFDPTNYVSQSEWQSIQFTEFVGKTLARNPLLKKVKDIIDKFARSRLPILKSITPSLLKVTREVDRPILSMHIATGNILLDHGKTVLQVITDPHVREEYLNHAGSKRMTYCVFDEKTRTDVLEQSALLGKDIDPNRVIVSGPPVDPRIIASRKNKQPWRSGPLNIVITTGGLGTNKSEIRKLLRQLMPEMRKDTPRFKILVYAGTHHDIYEMVEKLAKEEHIKVAPLENTKATLRILYHPQIVDANEALIKYGFPWADGFITKPSGDMAYDAAASGSFILTLAEWGVWEHNIAEFFEQTGISRKAEVEAIVQQLTILMEAQTKNASWVENAMLAAHNLPDLYLNGAKNIINAYKKLA